MNGGVSFCLWHGLVWVCSPLHLLTMIPTRNHLQADVDDVGVGKKRRNAGAGCAYHGCASHGCASHGGAAYQGRNHQRCACLLAHQGCERHMMYFLQARGRWVFCPRATMHPHHYHPRWIMKGGGGGLCLWGAERRVVCAVGTFLWFARWHLHRKKGVGSNSITKRSRQTICQCTEVSAPILTHVFQCKRNFRNFCNCCNDLCNVHHHTTHALLPPLSERKRKTKVPSSLSGSACPCGSDSEVVYIQKVDRHAQRLDPKRGKGEGGRERELERVRES